MKTPRKVREGSVPYSTKLQRRKRAEVETLRAKEAHLRAQLEKWQHDRDNHLHNAVPLMSQAFKSTRTTPTNSKWRSLAAMTYADRQRTELVNRKLRRALEMHHKLTGPLRKELLKDDVLEGFDFVFRPQPTVDRPLIQPTVTKEILAELAASLDQLRYEADMAFPIVDSSTAVSFRVDCDPVRGICTGTTAITPVSLPMQVVGDLLWQRIINVNHDNDTNVNKLFGRVRKSTLSSHDVTAMASCYENGQYVDAINTFRRYDEDHRIVLVGRTKWLLPSAGVLFEDQSWTVISPSLTNPTEACVSRFSYKLKVLEGSWNSSAVLGQPQEMMLRVVGERMRMINQDAQNRLIGDLNLGSI